VTIDELASELKPKVDPALDDRSVLTVTTAPGESATVLPKLNVSTKPGNKILLPPIQSKISSGKVDTDTESEYARSRTHISTGQYSQGDNESIVRNARSRSRSRSRSRHNRRDRHRRERRSHNRSHDRSHDRSRHRSSHDNHGLDNHEHEQRSRGRNRDHASHSRSRHSRHRYHRHRHHRRRDDSNDRYQGRDSRSRENQHSSERSNAKDQKSPEGKYFDRDFFDSSMEVDSTYRRSRSKQRQISGNDQSESRSRHRSSRPIREDDEGNVDRFPDDQSVLTSDLSLVADTVTSFSHIPDRDPHDLAEDLSLISLGTQHVIQRKYKLQREEESKMDAEDERSFQGEHVIFDTDSLVYDDNADDAAAADDDDTDDDDDTKPVTWLRSRDRGVGLN